MKQYYVSPKGIAACMDIIKRGEPFYLADGWLVHVKIKEKNHIEISFEHPDYTYYAKDQILSHTFIGRINTALDGGTLFCGSFTYNTKNFGVFLAPLIALVGPFFSYALFRDTLDIYLDWVPLGISLVTAAYTIVKYKNISLYNKMRRERLSDYMEEAFGAREDALAYDAPRYVTKNR